MLLTAGEISKLYRHSLELVATFDRYQVALRLGSLQSEIVYGVQRISFYLQINSNQPSHRIHNIAQDVAEAQLISGGVESLLRWYDDFALIGLWKRVWNILIVMGVDFIC